MKQGEKESEAVVDGERKSNSSDGTFEAGLGGERVVEDVHYGWLMRDHMARYEFMAPWCQGKRVLDVATGTGYGANILRRNGASEVVAVDRNQGALDYAADRYGGDGLVWVFGDAYDLPFQREFDVVVSFETIEHLKEPERFVVQCKKALKADGMFAVSTPENVGGPFVSEFHELEFSREQFRVLLERHFSSVDLMGQRRELATPIRPLGSVPERYWQRILDQRRGSHKMYTILDRLNKAPNHVLAGLRGYREPWRRQILPIDEPIQVSRFLKDQYYVMIALCRI